MKWQEYYKVLFGRIIPGDEVDGWDRRIDQAAPGVGEAEVLSALDSLAEDRIREHNDKFAPTANDIVSAIRKKRWQDRQQRETGPTMVCAICNNTGWRTVWTDNVSGEPIHICAEYAPGGRPFSVPCKCSRGNAVTEQGIAAGRTTRERADALMRVVDGGSGYRDFVE